MKMPVMPLRKNAAAVTASALLALALLCDATLSDARAVEAKKARIGEAYVFELEGNPSTGYRWRLDEKTSENAKIVKVEDLGYGKTEPRKDGRPLVGVPEPYQFSITPLSPGVAKLVFEYVQPWVGKPAKTHEHWVHASEQ